MNPVRGRKVNYKEGKDATYEGESDDGASHTRISDWRSVS